LETGIHQSKISLFENDLIAPTDDEKQRLAKALGVSVQEIFGDGKAPVSGEKGNRKETI
jgi:transcriptional regulator with XRE-family HTH domain